MKLFQFAALFGALLPWVEADSGFSRAKFTEWTGWGANYYNNRWASENKAISSSNINSITQHCKFSYPRGVSATPVVSGSTVFYPTWNGSFVALDYTNCHIQWSIDVTSIIVGFGPVSDLQVASNIVGSRTSPQIDGNVLYFGTLASALMVAVNRTTGEVLDVIQIDAHPAAIITMSPTFYNGKLIIGVSSSEESYATQPGYKCCTFVGHLTALSLDASTKKFKKIWDVPMIPPKLAATGWSGASVWGSQPAIDPVRGQVLIGTGNIYTVPDVIKACQTATKNITAVLGGLVADPCLPDTIWQESILAIDIELGIVNWVRQLTALDAWNLACLANGAGAANCPETPGPDYDFGMAPTFVPGSSSTPYGKDTLIVGQKSGELWALSAQAGAVFWSTATSPGGFTGGLSWGAAVDENRAYWTAINVHHDTFQIQPSNITTNSSIWGATNLLDGTPAWSTLVPGGNGVASAPVSTVGDLVLATQAGTGPLFDLSNGTFFAIKKSTGEVLYSLPLSGTARGGVTVQDDAIMFGTGYGQSTPNDYLGSFYVLKVRT